MLARLPGFHKSNSFIQVHLLHLGKDLILGGALRGEDADAGKSSEPGHELPYWFVMFLLCLHKLDFVKDIELLLHSSLPNLLH